MARLNSVLMMGVIQNDPIIKITKSGEYVSASMTILTARRSYMNEKQNLAGIVRSDMQQIVTKNPYLIENFILNLEVGDLILATGTLSTKEITRKIRCPYCGEVDNHIMGVKVYMDPKAILKIRSVAECDEQEINKLLITYSELSNYSQFFGTLVREPRYAPDFGVAKRELDIQVALNRKRYIVEDGPDKKTDYPYVRMFGQMAETCNKVLHTGSEIYIEGAIETREVEVERICPSCHEQFFASNIAVEIVPYSVEFTENVDVSILRDPELTAEVNGDNEKPDDEYDEDYDKDYDEESDNEGYDNEEDYENDDDYDDYEGGDD